MPDLHRIRIENSNKMNKLMFSNYVIEPGMRIPIRSDPLIFGLPDPDPLLYSTDPDQAPDPDPTCNNGYIK